MPDQRSWSVPASVLSCPFYGVTPGGAVAVPTRGLEAGAALVGSDIGNDTLKAAPLGLARAPGVELRAAIAPEHGRGVAPYAQSVHLHNARSVECGRDRIADYDNAELRPAIATPCFSSPCLLDASSPRRLIQEAAEGGTGQGRSRRSRAGAHWRGGPLRHPALSGRRVPFLFYSPITPSRVSVPAELANAYGFGPEDGFGAGSASGSGSLGEELGFFARSAAMRSKAAIRSAIGTGGGAHGAGVIGSGGTKGV